MSIIGTHTVHQSPIALTDRLRHVYVIGQTGTGKSSLLRTLIAQDRAFGLLDPHGDLKDEVLDCVPPNRTDDVLYFDPADVAKPIGFNPLEVSNRNLAAQGIIHSFRNIWSDSWGPRMEYVFSNCLLALMEYPGSNLLWVNRFLTDRPFRQRVVKRVKDPAVHYYWARVFANFREKDQALITSPIENKVGQFITDPIMRNIFSQPNMIHVKDIMDNGQIFIANLSKGQIGHNNSKLLGSLLTSQFEIAAMERANRDPFHLYLDEFQNFTTDSFESMLSESRKYGLGLTLAHQYIDQLPEGLQRAVFGNVGTFVILRVGYKDAAYLAKELDRVPTRFSELSRFRAIVKTLKEGEPEDVGEVALSNDVKVYGKKDNIIHQSRTRYGTDRRFVEKKIGEFYDAR